MIYAVLILALKSFTLSDALAEQEPGNGFSSLLKNNVALFDSAEFSIEFPNEKSPSVQKISIKAENKVLSASVLFENNVVKTVALADHEYHGLLNQFRSLSEQELGRKDTASCHNSVLFLARVMDSQHSFVGCRGKGANASVLSKIAHRTEFLVMKRLR